MRVDQIMVNPCKSPFEFRQVQHVHHKHMAILANSSSFFDTPKCIHSSWHVEVCQNLLPESRGPLVPPDESAILRTLIMTGG